MSGADPTTGPELGISSVRPFVMTSAFENDRSAILVEWVQQCALTPPMICVAVRKGRPIEPIIRDSHAFALCEIADHDLTFDRMIRRACEHDDDILESLPYETLRTGSPCVMRSNRVLDCEVIRHVDFEADYELYIAQVMEVKLYSPADHARAHQVRRSHRRRESDSVAFTEL